MTQYDYRGKVAIVTGAGSGIGEACALNIARSGGKIVVADYDREGGNRVTEAIRSEGGEATFVAVDVSKPEQNETMVSTAVTTYGGLHIAVNNAGIGGPQSPTGDYPIDGWGQVMGVNLSGVFTACDTRYRRCSPPVADPSSTWHRSWAASASPNPSPT